MSTLSFDICFDVFYNYSMFSNTITIREMMRKSSEIFEKVKQTGQPIVVVNRKEPQVAIIRLEDLKELEQQRMKNSARAALQFAKKMRQLLQDEKLPRDLSQNHDYYLWEAEPQK